MKELAFVRWLSIPQCEIRLRLRGCCQHVNNIDNIRPKHRTLRQRSNSSLVLYCVELLDIWCYSRFRYSSLKWSANAGRCMTTSRSAELRTGLRAVHISRNRAKYPKVLEEKRAPRSNDDDFNKPKAVPRNYGIIKGFGRETRNEIRMKVVFNCTPVFGSSTCQNYLSQKCSIFRTRIH